MTAAPHARVLCASPGSRHPCIVRKPWGSHPCILRNRWGQPPLDGAHGAPPAPMPGVHARDAGRRCAGPRGMAGAGPPSDEPVADGDRDGGRAGGDAELGADRPRRGWRRCAGRSPAPPRSPCPSVPATRRRKTSRSRGVSCRSGLGRCAVSAGQPLASGWPRRPPRRTRAPRQPPRPRRSAPPPAPREPAPAPARGAAVDQQGRTPAPRQSQRARRPTAAKSRTAGSSRPSATAIAAAASRTVAGRA